MHQIIYFSSSKKYLNPEEISELLSKSRENNLKNNITGVLLYFNGDFLQVIEGPKVALLELFEDIKKDERHTGILTVFNKNIKERHFPNWNMGFSYTDYEKLRKLSGIENFNKTELSKINDKTALILIEKFIDSHTDSSVFV